MKAIVIAYYYWSTLKLEHPRVYHGDAIAILKPKLGNLQML